MVPILKGVEGVLQEREGEQLLPKRSGTRTLSACSKKT